MKKIKFSIIIPAYNAEKTIKSCVDSVLVQDYDSYEIIIVDDGSKDATARILREEYGDNKKITILSQENKGVSAARNRALNEASGEWVIFLDSDDKILAKSLFNIDKSLHNSRADCLITRLKRQGCNYASFADRTFCDKRALIDSAIFCEGKPYDPTLSEFDMRAIGGKVYRRTIISSNKLLFFEDLRKFEDGLFNIDFFLAADLIVCSAIFFYEYSCDNPNSRTNTRYSHEYEDNQLILSRLSDTISRNNYETNAVNDVALPLFILAIDDICGRDLSSKKKKVSTKLLHSKFLPYLRMTNKSLFGHKKKFELAVARRKSDTLVRFLYTFKNLVKKH